MSHQNIVSLYEVYEDERYIHLVFDLLHDSELKAKVEENNCLKDSEAAEIMKVLFNTVKYCHDNDIVHCDIKPRNILLRFFS